MTQAKVVICPYCGATQAASERCHDCGGFFEAYSRQATHNAMGPWFVRDAAKPFHPGCSYETLVRMVDRGQINKYSIIRGPTTKQFWTVAKHVPGLAHLLGYCPNCDASVDASDHGCHACGVPFGAFLDRNYMGLPEVQPLPWEQDVDRDEAGALGSGLKAAGGGYAGGLSRFASDEELLASGPGPSSRSHPSAGPMRAHEPPDADEDAPDGQSVFDDYASSTVTRALRRKLNGQQRTIRLLTILLIATIVVAIGANLGPLAATLRNGGSATSGGSPAAAGSRAETPDEPVARIVAQHQPDSSPADPEVEDSTPAPAPPEPSIQARQYEQAMTLMTAARATDRSLDDRIGDYERALEVLKTVEGSAPPDEQPGDLAARIDEVEQELERLRLKREFFGVDESE